ncbi:MAG: MerR family transcriptional regulator [Firmicutes bacterium]|uniref:MerR family transcriptional regulator, glutamine synthetase repressor n=1 Tax=Melghirimyces thermohalophilus TaxID=1236220 RepID=A0A1G6J6J8_9BACL|nr:MerR family transcriptional regulator [Melghirimyces thermohalophilus]MDA8351820.1 MerR family transcriptional regulator [Bacillota bacterium]SDC14213.1 MerR family transcriptional regulator, glutamine synthetase repressor [Melghirimyces thermohalophilus]
MSDEIRRNMPLFSMGTITKLTDLTPRQVRYYEQQDLIRPERTRGNQRLFSFHDVDRLLQIKSLMEKGVNIAGVKEILQDQDRSQDSKRAEQKPRPSKPDLSEEELHKLLKRQLSELSYQPNRGHLISGELSRFFH